MHWQRPVSTSLVTSSKTPPVIHVNHVMDVASVPSRNRHIDEGTTGLTPMTSLNDRRESHDRRVGCIFWCGLLNIQKGGRARLFTVSSTTTTTCVTNVSMDLLATPGDHVACPGPSGTNQRRGRQQGNDHRDGYTEVCRSPAICRLLFLGLLFATLAEEARVSGASVSHEDGSLTPPFTDPQFYDGCSGNAGRTQQNPEHPISLTFFFLKKKKSVNVFCALTCKFCNAWGPKQSYFFLTF